MSSEYSTNWDELSNVFNPPMHFSDRCDQPSTQIGTQLCPTICIKLLDSVNFKDTKIGYIRGCYDRLLKLGFNQAIVRKEQWLREDKCRTYKKSLVIPGWENSGDWKNSDDEDFTVTICVCYGDFCNGVARILPKSDFFAIVILTIIMTILL